MKLYPSANILVATAKDFETGNRKKFCARIATGDYDAVIIGHINYHNVGANNYSPLHRYRRNKRQYGQ